MILDEKLGVNFYIKTSKVDSNIEKAVTRKSHLYPKYTVRKNFCKLLEGY